MQERIAVVGLGYVGLPLALAFARTYPDVLGFDINKERVAALKDGIDSSGETATAELKDTTLKLSSDPESLRGYTFFVVSVPTPVDGVHRPDLTPVLSASRSVGKYLSKGSVVVYESTVYPTVTEEICGPILAEVSGLKSGVDFKLGYSPERINPGDKEHTLARVVKIVAGQDSETLERVAGVYEKVVTAGVHRASSIQVAEAAKVIENTQRDLNIALMNELAIIFDRMAIPTSEVLAAAGTKWNFLKFSPGLVGGHCIGVDPYYLTTKAEQLGYHPQVILAGRRINDGMGAFIASKTVKLMVNAGLPVKGARVGILGLTFKENVADIRNSRVPDIIAELRQYGLDPRVHDPLADAKETDHEYGVALSNWEDMAEFDALVFAVSHKFYLEQGVKHIGSLVRKGGVLIDVKSVLDRSQLDPSVRYWSL